jgi:hypothetical protein
LINSVPNKIKISGHTDALAFNPANKAYGNWELSAERANAARRELINGQMDPDKVLQIDAMGSAVPFDKDNLLNPVNRRIAIVVMNIKAEARVRGDQKMLEIIEANDAELLLQNLEDQQSIEDEPSSTSQAIAPASTTPTSSIEADDNKTQVPVNPAGSEDNSTPTNSAIPPTADTPQAVSGERDN